MRTHYVIVHEQCVRNNLIRYPEMKNLISVLHEISRIKREESWSESPDDPAILSSSLPRNQSDLIVFVCGAYSGRHKGNPWWCVDQQLSALKKKGYSAEILESATLNTDFELDEIKRYQAIFKALLNPSH